MMLIFIGMLFCVCFGACAADTDAGSLALVFRLKRQHVEQEASETPKKKQRKERVEGIRKTQRSIDNQSVLEYLLAHKGAKCRWSDLLRLVGKNNKVLNLTLAIVDLRKEGYSIEHSMLDSEGEGVVLNPEAKRVVNRGSYEKYLWDMLKFKCFSLMAPCKLSLILSDLGYDPVLERVESMKYIKLLSINSAKVPLVRRRIWGVLTQECVVRDEHYYGEHPLILGRVRKSDVRFAHQCWTCYQEVFFGYQGNLTDNALFVRDFLKQHPSGVSKRALALALQEKLKPRVDIWAHVNILLCNGSAGNVSYRQDMFFWDDGGTFVPFKKRGVFDDLYEIVRSDIREGEVVFQLYKRGHFLCRPSLVIRMLNILCAAEYVCMPQRCFFDVWKGISEGSLRLNELVESKALDVEFILNLRKRGVFQKIQNKQPVTFEEVFEWPYYDRYDVIYVRDEQGTVCDVPSLAMDDAFALRDVFGWFTQFDVDDCGDVLPHDETRCCSLGELEPSFDVRGLNA